MGTVLNEFFATLADMRAKSLEQALQSIIDDPKLRAYFYDSGVIDGVNKALGKKPSYISSDNFALALLSSLDPTKSLPVFADISQSVQDMADCNIRDILLAQVAAASGNIDKLRAGIATWFDAAMDRVAGLYKRNIKLISLVIGIAIAVVFNADSIFVCEALWQDQGLRSAMVDVAKSELSKAAPSVDGNAASSPEQLAKNIEALKDSYIQAKNALKPLPIGWGSTTLWKGGEVGSNLVNWILRIVGWLVTGIAISLRAPFWFDLLSKFINIRGTGDKPDRAAAT